jgi:hypothetical protein
VCRVLFGGRRGPRELKHPRGAHEQGRATLVPQLAESARAALVHPAVAAVLGALLGAAMLLATRRGVRFMTPEEPELGVARALAISGLGMIAAFFALLLYFLYLRAGLVPFGLGLVAGFMVPAFIALFSASGLFGLSTQRR